MSQHTPQHSAIEDAANASAQRFLSWCARHPRTLGGAAAVLVLVGLGLWGMGRAADSQIRHDSVAFAKALEIADGRLQAEVQAQQKARQEAEAAKRLAEQKRAAESAKAAARDTNDTSAAVADDALDDQDEQDEQAMAEEDLEERALFDAREARRPTFADAQARSQAAEAAFLAVAEGAKSRSIAPLARVEAAHYAELSGDAEAAKTQLAALYAAMSSRDGLWPLLASRYATYLENSGDAEGALAVWERLGSDEQRYLADEAGVQRARILADKGDVEGARTLLNEVKMQFPDTQLGEEIRAALLELPAAAPAGAPQAPAAP